MVRGSRSRFPLPSEGASPWIEGVSRILNSSGWWKLAVVMLLFLVFYRLGSALYWPLRLLITSGLVLGCAQLLVRAPLAEWKSWWGDLLLHPVSVLFLFTAVSLMVKEEFPFSHFHMYSDPDPMADYVYIRAGTDEASAEPLSVIHVCKITAAKVKKMYRSHAKKINRNVNALSAAEQEKAATEVLRYLVERAHQNAWQVDQVPLWWEFVYVRIVPVPGEGIREESRVFATWEGGPAS